MHSDDIDNIWNYSNFDEHYELIQSGGYENLHQIAGATGATGAPETTVTPVTPSAVSPTGLNVTAWIVIVLFVLLCIGVIVWALTVKDDF